MQFVELDYEVEDGTAWVFLNRPHRLNAFNLKLYDELRAAVRLADRDPEVDTVVITGRGRAFATGGDLDEAIRALEDPDDPLAIFRFADAVPFEALRSATTTTIAAVNGLCMGGGLITAAACDISIAAESAVFSIVEGRVGMAEGWVPALLFGRVSLTTLKYLAYTAKEIPASEAERIGMITEAVPDEQLYNRVREVVTEVRATPPLARRRYKELFDRLQPHANVESMWPTLFSDDVQQALRAHLSRREGQAAATPPAKRRDEAEVRP